jgi:hypothetical protein
MTVTRVELIDHRTGGQGRMFVAYGCAVELSYQDDGRTLKVFVTDPAAPSDLRGLVDAAERTVTAFRAMTGAQVSVALTFAVSALADALASRTPAPSTETSDQ